MNGVKTGKRLNKKYRLSIYKMFDEYKMVRKQKRFMLNILDLLATIMMLDDEADIGKIERIHHWQIGYLAKTGVEIVKYMDIIKDAMETVEKYQ